MTKISYQTRISQAQKAGFEIYSDTFKYADGVAGERICGSILTNTKKNSPYDGEVLDLFEDDTYEHYSQFNQNHPHYKPVSFQFKNL